MSCPRCSCPYCVNERTGNSRPLLEEMKEKVRLLAEAQYKRQMRDYKTLRGQINAAMAK